MQITRATRSIGCLVTSFAGFSVLTNSTVTLPSTPTCSIQLSDCQSLKLFFDSATSAWQLANSTSTGTHSQLYYCSSRAQRQVTVMHQVLHQVDAQSPRANATSLGTLSRSCVFRSRPLPGTIRVALRSRTRLLSVLMARQHRGQAGN